jgi:zinc transport system permease protein
MDEPWKIFVTGLLMALFCGFLGTFVLLRRLSFLTDTLAHGSILGIGLGHALGFTPTSTLIPFSILLGLGLVWVSRNRAESLNAVTAVAFSGCVGFGVLLMNHEGKADPHDLIHILFGNLTHIESVDALLLLVLGLPSMIYLWYQRKNLILTFLDENLAQAENINAGKYQYAFMICTALTIALCLKLVGVVLVMALITIPSLITGRFTKNLGQQLILSPFVAISITLLGIILSYEFNLSSGPMIASLCAGLFIISVVLIPVKRRG